MSVNRPRSSLNLVREFHEAFDLPVGGEREDREVTLRDGREVASPTEA